MPTGSCFCGNIALEYTGKLETTVNTLPVPVLDMANHVRLFVIVAIVARSAMAITATTFSCLPTDLR